MFYMQISNRLTNSLLIKKTRLKVFKALAAGCRSAEV